MPFILQFGQPRQKELFKTTILGRFQARSAFILLLVPFCCFFLLHFVSSLFLLIKLCVFVYIFCIDSVLSALTGALCIMVPYYRSWTPFFLLQIFSIDANRHIFFFELAMTLIEYHQELHYYHFIIDSICLLSLLLLLLVPFCCY